jgi:hypothetical protein
MILERGIPAQVLELEDERLRRFGAGCMDWAGVLTLATSILVQNVVTRGPLSEAGRELTVGKPQFQRSMHQDLVSVNEFEIVQKQQHPCGALFVPDPDEDEIDDGALQPADFKSLTFEGGNGVADADVTTAEHTEYIAATGGAAPCTPESGHANLEAGVHGVCAA